MLVARGHEVAGVDNISDAYDPRLKRWRLNRLSELKGFTHHECDITDRAALDRLFSTHKFEGVINLAARAGVRQSLRDPWTYYGTNLTGALNLMDQCRNHSVKRFVQASTSSVYGSNRIPFSEDQPTERPLSPYAASKKAAEELSYTYHHLYGLNVTVLRFFTVYGPAGRPDMSIFRFIKWTFEDEPLTLLGDGSQERDFTFVDDVARGVVAALTLGPGYRIINLGGDRPAPLTYVISEIERHAGKKARLNRCPPDPADIKATWADITRAREVLGWNPQVTLESGLESCVRWYLDNRDWAKEIAL